MRCNQQEIVSCDLPTEFGNFVLHAIDDPEPGREHVAISMGEVGDGAPVLVRLHSECLTGDIFHSLRCDCGPQLHAAIRSIADVQRGIVIYLRHEGRGIGLVNKIRAYRLQEKGADTVEANRMLGFADDLRRYDGAKILLAALRVSSVKLMTNNPQKIEALRAFGIDVIERIPLHVGLSSNNEYYVLTKARRMGHWSV